MYKMVDESGGGWVACLPMAAWAPPYTTVNAAPSANSIGGLQNFLSRNDSEPHPSTCFRRVDPAPRSRAPGGLSAAVYDRKRSSSGLNFG